MLNHGFSIMTSLQPKAVFETVPRLALIDYGMGNLRSVARAFEHEGASVLTVSRPEEIKDADALIFPGQGAIVDCMRCLRETGFDQAIRDWIAEDKPFFGICLGLQALFEHSEEGDTACLGIFPGQVKRFRATPALKVPQMGWNQAVFRPGAPLIDGLSPAGDYFYFVHSYYVDTPAADLIWCETVYGLRYTSGIARGRCFATQFHPEKSQAKGLQIYKNFLLWLSSSASD